MALFRCSNLGNPFLKNLLPNAGDMTWLSYDSGSSGLAAVTNGTCTTASSGFIIANAKNKTSLVLGSESSVVQIKADGSQVTSYAGTTTVALDCDYVIIAYRSAGTFSIS